MQKLIKVVAIGFVTGLFSILHAQLGGVDNIGIPIVKSESTSSCETHNNAFGDGEILTYRIYYNWNFVWLSAGEVTFSVKEDDAVYHLRAEGSTYKAYEWLFKVKDSYHSVSDSESLLPISSTRNIAEGKYRLYEKVQFNRLKGKAISERGRTQDKTRIDTLEVPGCVQDILSMLYATRNLEFSEMTDGDVFDANILLDKEIYPVSIKYVGADQSVKIRKLGKFDTVLFSPETQSGRIFNENSQMKIWVTNDANRVPLMVESPISVGSVKAVLKDARNLRHTSELERLFIEANEQ